jgi:hypothetical protein
VVDNLRADPSLYRRLDDVVVPGEFVAEMFEDFLGAPVYADDVPYRIATELTASKEQMTELLLAMPSHHPRRDYAGDGQMVDAPYTGAGVRVEPTPTTPGHRGVQRPSSAPRRSAERKRLRIAG